MCSNCQDGWDQDYELDEANIEQGAEAVRNIRWLLDNPDELLPEEAA